MADRTVRKNNSIKEIPPINLSPYTTTRKIFIKSNKENSNNNAWLGIESRFGLLNKKQRIALLKFKLFA